MLNGSMIIERIENENGRALKFEDGTMICYTSKDYSFKFSAQWGVLYETPNFNLGNTPFSFILPPFVVGCISRGAGFIEYIRGMTTQNYGDCCVARPKTDSIEIEFSIDIIAIGRWK